MTARKRNYTLSELLTGVLMGAMVGFVLSVLASATLEGMTINRTADNYSETRTIKGFRKCW